MPTTLSDVRTRVRLRLEESSAAIWTDNEIDECSTAALEELGWSYPVEDSGTATVADGDTSCAVPSGALRVVRVIEEDGTVIPPRSLPAGSTASERLAWEVFDATIWFGAELAAQDLTIWYLRAPAIGDIVGADIGVLVAGSVWRCLLQKGVQEVKRRGGGSPAALIAAAEGEYRRLLGAKGRRLKAGRLSTG